MVRHNMMILSLFKLLKDNLYIKLYPKIFKNYYNYVKDSR